MIDIETMGNKPTSIICSVGAAVFNLETKEIGATFNSKISMKSSEKYGFTYDASTIYWWLKQSEEARKSILLTDEELKDPKLDLKYVMTNFRNWITSQEPLKSYWAKGQFDLPMLNYHFEKLGIDPLDFRRLRDIRTLMDLSNVNQKDYPNIGNAHSALDDCLYQISYTRDALNSVNFN